jgi:hypothetical protein
MSMSSILPDREVSLPRPERGDEEAASAAEREKRQQRKAVWSHDMVGLATAIALTIAWDFREPVARAITAYGILALVEIAGAGLYALRGRYRLVYGVAETAVATLRRLGLCSQPAISTPLA